MNARRPVIPISCRSHRLAFRIRTNYGSSVPRKIRELIRDLQSAGFQQKAGAGKGSHRKFYHDRFPGAVTLSGQEGADAKSYQEKQIKKAIENVEL